MNDLIDSELDICVHSNTGTSMRAFVSNMKVLMSVYFLRRHEAPPPRKFRYFCRVVELRTDDRDMVTRPRLLTESSKTFKNSVFLHYQGSIIAPRETHTFLRCF